MEETYGMQDYSDGISERSVDPVCGRVIVEEKAAGKLDYAGETFYFCSKDCQDRFQENPGGFLGQPK